MGDQESNPFGISLWRENLKLPSIKPDGVSNTPLRLKDPKLDVRSIKNSRPTFVERGLVSHPFISAKKSLGGAQVSTMPILVNEKRVGLSTKQAKLFDDAIKRGAAWLPKAKKEWENFKKALDAGTPLPEKVTIALKVNFGWMNMNTDNHNLPPIPMVIDGLLKELNTDLPASFHPQREESPNSSASDKFYTRARPRDNEDGSQHGLILYPDFFESNRRTAVNPNDARAKTVIHEILHTWEKEGGTDWHDVAQEWQRKDVGKMNQYLFNPASYAGLIHDLAQ